jgi:hypothetical protein
MQRLEKPDIYKLVNVRVDLVAHAFQTVSTVTATAQVAPTIVKALGLDPAALDAVRTEGTSVLPEVAAELETRR